MLIVVLIVFTALCFMIGGFMGAVWVPISKKDLSALIRNLKLNSKSHVIEFGSGDGRFLKSVEKQGAHVIGFEINPLLWLYASVVCIHKRRIKNRLGSAWDNSFKKADVVFAFLMPKFMHRLEKKLSLELEAGTIVVTYHFPLPNRRHYLHENNSYYYKWPARRA